MNDLTKIPTQTADADIVTVPVANFDAKGYVGIVFDPFKKQISKAKRDAAKAEAYDITTTAGMSQAKELRASFRDIRTSIENERKLRKAPIIEAGKLLDSRAAELRAEVEPLEDKYDAEIKVEEARKAAEKARKEAEERARVEAIENRIAHIRGAASRLASADSGTVKAELNTWTLLRLEPADYQEYLEDAITAVNTAIDQLTDLLAKAEEREAEARRIAAEREELARMKAEQVERERVAAAEAAERERQAQAERDAAADRAAEQQRQMDVMRAEQEKQMHIMAEIAKLQQAAMMEGDARAIDATLERLTSTIIDEQSFGMMTGMARTARNMAVSSLTMRLRTFCDAAHEEALAKPAAPTAIRVDPPAAAPLPITQMALVDEAPAYEVHAQPQRPTDGEIIEVLATTFEASEDAVTRWLVDLVKGLEA